MAWAANPTISSPALAGHQPISDTDTTQNHEIGKIITAFDATYGEGEFIYLKGVASCAVGSLVLYNPDDFSTSLATADDKGFFAVAMSACVASNFGWFQIKGKASVAALTGFADNADCYLTSTAGSIDDAVVAGDLIYNMKGASAVSGGVADVEIDHPYALDGDVLDSTAIAASGAEINAVADVSGRVIDLNATSLSVTAATHGERIVTLSHTAAASTVTLPAASGTGNKYMFIVAAVNTNNHVIQVANASDVFEGIAFMANDVDNSVSGFETAAASDTITLNGTTTGGAAIGDRVELIDYATNKWHILAHLTGTGTEATPFSAAV